jgi:acetyl esterase/lipase
MPVTTRAYGTHHDQFGELTLPKNASADRPAPVAVLVHGGSWKADYDLDRLRPLAADLARRGWAAWNLEYRRVGPDSGGGWPQTLQDVSAGVDHLAALQADGLPLDLGRVVTIGHSAGGHLALLDGARDAAEATVRPRAVVGIAPLTDVRRAHALGGGETIEAFLGGGPDDRPDVYEAASTVSHLPLGVPQLVVHGDRDEHVSAEVAADHVAAAREAGDDAVFELSAGHDHFSVVEPGSTAWAAVLAYLDGIARAD